MTTKKISSFPVAPVLLPTDVAIGNANSITSQIPFSLQLAFMEDNISNLGNVSGNFSGIHTGDGSGLTGITGQTGGISNLVNTNFVADSDDNGSGLIDFSIGPNSAMQVLNNGIIRIVNKAVIGHTIPLVVSPLTPTFQVHSNDTDAGMSVSAWSADINGPHLILSKSRSATIGSNAIVLDGDTLGLLDFVGDDGTDLQQRGATIEVVVDGTPDANKMPGAIILKTSSGVGSPTETMTLAADKGIFMPGLKSGATQVAALASINETWYTVSHATLPDGVQMQGL